MISKTEGVKKTTYAFDVWGNMTSGAGASYTYNVQGLRTSKTVGNKTNNFKVVNGKVWSDGTYKYVWGAELITNGSVYYLYNAHGDVVQLVNANGAVTKTYDYEAYGNELTRDAADPNPFRYCGEYYDVETGFIYLRARYYDPMVGRFTSQDPVKDGLNWYAYCNNNPVVLVDRNGLWPSWSQIFTATAIVVTAAVVVAATVATAGAAGAAIGISAGMAAGGSAAVAGAATTIATGCIYGVAGYVGATAASDTIEVFSGYNPIRDFIYRGNVELYETTEILAYGAAAVFTEIGSQNYGLYNPSTVNRSNKRLLNEMTNDKISELTVDEIREALPEGWSFHSNNGRIHVKDDCGTMRIRIDPPDSTTPYTHMHIYDEFKNPLDISGKIVDRTHPSAHIPWNDKSR